MSREASGRAATRPAVRTSRRDRQRVRVIPYDHVASFELTGQPGTLHQDVINVGVEGVFVAVAIGYGLSSLVAVPLPLRGNGDESAEELTLTHLPSYALIDGIRINPEVDSVVFRRRNGRESNRPDFSPFTIAEADELGLFQTIRPARDFSFLFNLVDTGSGRELQNAPIHSIAGLGKSNGERPFRPLAKPLSFLPRSSVRVEVEEQTPGVQGTLHLALHGYKILGAAGVPEDALRALDLRLAQRNGRRAASESLIDRVEAGALPSKRVVPFDYARSLRLTGRPRTVLEEEITINVEGRYVATAIGYGLVADTAVVPPQTTGEKDDPLTQDTVPVGEIRLSQFTSEALRGGFRIRPSLLRATFNGALTSQPLSTVLQLFEPMNVPERVQFLYSIEDTGTGRAWQDQPVHSIAGLGIANGDRPFRQLAFPMDFLPRSTIRLRVEEIFGRGQLHLVFQGYRVLGES